jgi:hypothetical protein
LRLSFFNIKQVNHHLCGDIVMTNANTT